MESDKVSAEDQSLDLSVRKRALRSRMRAVLSGLPSDRAVTVGSAAAQAIRSLPQWRSAASLLAFASMRGEVASDGIIASALADGLRVLLPRTGNADIVFVYFPVPVHAAPRALESAFAGLEPRGPFGIREPALDLPAIEPSSLPGPLLVLVPGLAFDRRGGRLGRGKGYYDRFVSRLQSCGVPYELLGLCLPEQLVDEVPSGPGDLRVGALLVGEKLLSP